MQVNVTAKVSDALHVTADPVETRNLGKANACLKLEHPQKLIITGREEHERSAALFRCSVLLVSEPYQGPKSVALNICPSDPLSAVYGLITAALRCHILTAVN